MEIFTGFSLIWHCRKKQYLDVGLHQLKLNIDLHSYILHSGVYNWLSWEAPIIGIHYLLFTICGLKERERIQKHNINPQAIFPALWESKPVSL